jgi:hypothetical protein
LRQIEQQRACQSHRNVELIDRFAKKTTIEKPGRGLPHRFRKSAVDGATAGIAGDGRRANPPFLESSALLAEMQMTINAAGLRMFDGNLDRFVIVTLLGRETVLSKVEMRPIPVHALAISLNRSPETVRRHVDALIATGFCERQRGGVVVKADLLQRHDFTAMLALVHDCFVRFVEDLRLNGPIPETTAAPRGYDWRVGLRTAIDIMLATLENNTTTHGSWLDLVIFSAVLCANARRYGDDSGALGERHAVPMIVVARTLGLPEATVRRHIRSSENGAIARTAKGLLVSETWSRDPAHREISLHTQSNIRRLLIRAGNEGFPFNALDSAYLVGRPPRTEFV